MSLAVCESCHEGDHRQCEAFLSNGSACGCDETGCGANAEPDKETKK